MGNSIIFLSSTSKELSKHRDEVYKRIEAIDGYHCVRMEDFGARGAKPNEFDEKKVRECDIFVGLIGPLFGSSPEDDPDRSFTECEYECAIELGKPCLLFLSDDDFQLASYLRESDKSFSRQQKFRQRVASLHICDRFSDPLELAAKVVTALRNHERQVVDDIRAEDVNRVLIYRSCLLILG